MSLVTILYVIFGGALGTFLCYAISSFALPISGNLPWGTIIINITGSRVIGLVGTPTLAHGRYPISENSRLFLMVCFCGAYTTISSFSLQTLDLLRGGAVGRATANIAMSVTLCVCAVAAGHFIAARFNEGAVEIAQTNIEEEA